MKSIEINGLCKYFKLYGHPRQILSEAFWGRTVPAFTALEHVSFDVARGEVVGVMGRNGAGKSTLLRILAGTLNASAGRVRVGGRVSAILELGSGFNMDYTGRENIVSGGMCMGMSRDEMLRKTDSIIEFSQLREFIDNPFKTYSSGMQARLTFATAIAVDPEILIVDEALAVGDARFQARCYERIQELRDEGKSILLASHSDSVINQFCDRAILLERGRLVMDDSPLKVVNTYSDLIFGKKETLQVDLLEKSRGGVDAGGDAEQVTDSPSPPAGSGDSAGGVSGAFWSGADMVAGFADIPRLDAESRAALREAALRSLSGKRSLQGPGDCERLGAAVDAEILHIYAKDEKGEAPSLLTPGERYTFGFLVLFYERVDRYAVGCHIRSSKGITVHGATTWLQNDARPCFADAARGDIVEATVDMRFSLTNGTYFLTFAIANYSDGVEENYIMDGCCDALPLPVANKKGLYDCSIVDLEPVFNATKLLPGDKAPQP